MAADAVAMNVDCSGLNATGGRPTTDFGGAGLWVPSSAARSVSAASARARRCAISTRGQKNHAKNGMSIPPSEAIVMSVPSPAAAASSNVSVIAGC